MATQVLIAHTGRRLELDMSQFTIVDDFKASIARQSSIPAQYIIALTPQGRPLRLQILPTEKEIYIYDIRLSQPPSPGVSPSTNVEVNLPKRYSVSSPPNSINDTRSLAAWQDLFKMRRIWADKVLNDCFVMAETTRERYGEMDVILRCIDAAIANLESVVGNLDPKYQELKKWVTPAQAGYSTLVTSWEQYLGLARSIPISPEMVHFMTGRNVNGKGRASRQPTLEDLLDLETVKKAGRLAPQALRKFNQRVADLDKAATRMLQNCQEVTREFERVVARSAMSHDGDTAQLLEDIKPLTRKIETDSQTIMEYTNTSRDLLQASKTAANHTERLLPSIRARALEMDEMLRYATQARNALALEGVDFMRSITDITSLSSTVKSQINIVNQEDELATFDYLRLIQQVPYMYASFAVEAVKRREWYDKVKTDSSTLANEMALFQDEEVKRRRKWSKSIDNAYAPQTSSAENNVPGLEVNLRGQDEEWPNMTKKDLIDFHESLQRQMANQELVDDIGKLIADLNNPTKQQSKRLKAFKNGSIHEAALGKSGLLIRGDDDVLRTVQEEKTKVENKLKTAESRVKRLEDLLHRQSQASRPTLGNLFNHPSQQLSNQNGSVISVKSAVTAEDRRRSTEIPDGLLQRLQQLEGELTAEKEKSAALEKDLGSRTTQHEDMAGQIKEANSTKTDLLKNMEALKREFVEERKSLEDDIKQLKARIEDTEDEIEHFGESRENEKATYDERVHLLEEELEQLTKKSRDEVVKFEGQVEFLRKESRLQRESVEMLEQQLLSAQDETKSLSKKLEAADETARTRLRALQDLHRQLSPNTPVPEDAGDLIEAVTAKSASLFAKIQDVEADASLIKSDLEQAHNTVKDLRAEVASTSEKLANEEETAMHLRENISEEKARVTALEGELEVGRQELSGLRDRLADGETGSETLRKKLEDEAKKIISMAEDLASKQSQVGSLEEELLLYKDRLDKSQAKLSILTDRFIARTEHTKDLTQKLYSHNERLCRLLERLGFSVTRQNNTMTIQKVPRTERSGQNLTDSIDPSASIRRSVTLSQSPGTGDLDLLYWMNNSDPDTETEKYQAFMSELGSFDMDAFSETVYRRVKDIEHMARRMQRDSRSYREKAHTLQKEAHDKIAFKNFKDGDLALFLPTRNQTTGAWAAFNIGFPHYFLREQEAHRLRSREWLLARISRVQERVVDLSKSLHQQPPPSGTSATEADSINEEENDNPFDLSDGLRWYLIDAHEDKPGAPSTPGLAKTTVAANTVEAMGSHTRTASGKGLGLVGRPTGIDGVSKTLSKSLESRRSSTSSRKAIPFAIGGGRGSAFASEANSIRATAADTPLATSPNIQHSMMQSALAQTPLSAEPVGQKNQGSAAQDSATAVEQRQQGSQEPRAEQTAPRCSEVRKSEMDDLLGP